MRLLERKMTKKRLRALEYPEDIVKDVAEIVRLSEDLQKTR